MQSTLVPNGRRLRTTVRSELIAFFVPAYWGLIASALSLGILGCEHRPSSDQPSDRKQSSAIGAATGKVIASSAKAFGPTIENDANPSTSSPAGMVWIPGGEFSMGCESKNDSLCGLPGLTSDTHPIHRVYVDPFWMDETEVTNAQYREFVDATGYVTVAERKPTPEELPGVPVEALVAGSVVFTPTDKAVSLDRFSQWWAYVPGVSWKHPLGPDSDLIGKDDYPVVHIAYEDAEAYAKWAGKRLPTEAEWEFAARGGKAGELYVWGNTLKVDDKYAANIYQGSFPVQGGDSASDGWKGIAPVKQYAPNGYGLYDVSGNVWEWASDWYRADYYATLHRSGEVARNPQGPENSFDPREPSVPKRVHRGGSFLCSDLYCSRYMLGTRGKGDVKSASNHVGFRCVKPANH